MAKGKPKEVTIALFFSNQEPHVTGYLTLGKQHFEIAGIRRSNVRTDLTARRIETQADLFEETKDEAKPLDGI